MSKHTDTFEIIDECVVLVGCDNLQDVPLSERLHLPQPTIDTAATQQMLDFFAQCIEIKGKLHTNMPAKRKFIDRFSNFHYHYFKFISRCICRHNIKTRSNIGRSIVSSGHRTISTRAMDFNVQNVIRSVDVFEIVLQLLSHSIESSHTATEAGSIRFTYPTATIQGEF